MTPQEMHDLTVEDGINLEIRAQASKMYDTPVYRGAKTQAKLAFVNGCEWMNAKLKGLV